jgi:hypothetical protein
MQGGTISYNEAAANGGGVYVYDRGTFEMSGSGTISDNDAAGNGGGVYVYSNGTFEMSGSSSSIIINDNNALNGGGVYVYRNGTFEMSGSSIINDNNALNGNGGGVYNAGKFDMNDGAISDNKAAGNETLTGNGGGVYNIGTFTMNDGAISGNTAAGSTTNRADDHSDHGSAPDEDGNYGEGGGVYGNDANTFKMYGGIIYGADSFLGDDPRENKGASGLSTYAITWEDVMIDRQSDNNAERFP